MKGEKILMKIYRVHYGKDIKQGMYQGLTGSKDYEKWDVRDRMELKHAFDYMTDTLHYPEPHEFDIKPNSNSLFYFKEGFYNDFKPVIDDFILTASRIGITVSVIEIDLSNVKSYMCAYQDKHQMCLDLDYYFTVELC